MFGWRKVEPHAPAIPERCLTCNGAGMLERRGDASLEPWVLCPNCVGTGQNFAVDPGQYDDGVDPYDPYGDGSLDDPTFPALPGLSRQPGYPQSSRSDSMSRASGRAIDSAPRHYRRTPR